MQIEHKFNSIKEIPLPWPLYQEVYQRPWDDRPSVVTLERGIEKLVRVINGFGMQTTGSCEGHLTDHRFPWVQIAGLQYEDFWVRKEMIRLTGEYNGDKPGTSPQWTVSEWAEKEWVLRTAESASSNEELLGLRQGADDFAQYLFDKYLRLP